MLRTLFKRHYSLFLIPLALSISCTNLVDNIDDSSDTSNSDTSKIIYLSGCLDINTNATASELGTISSSNDDVSSRSAIPGITVDGTNYQYFVNATAPGVSDSVTGTINSSAKTFTIPLKSGYTWTLTAGIKNSSGDSVLSASCTQKITAVTAKLENCNMILLPDTTGTGKVSLSMSDTSSDVADFSITAEGDNQTDWDNAVASDPANVINKTSIQVTSVPSGTYKLLLTYKNSEGRIIFSTRQTINVYKNLTTDTWKPSSSDGGIINSSGNFILTSTLVSTYSRTDFYVGPTNVCTNPLDSNGGSAYDPLATIQKALDVISEAGQSNSDYIIHLSGTFSEALDINLPSTKASSITITNATGKTATLSGDSNSDGTGDIICLTVTSEVPLVLDGLTIKKGLCGLYVNNASADVKILNCSIENNNAEADKDGGGIRIDSASSVYIEDCSITSNSARKGGGIYVKQGSFKTRNLSILNNTASSSGGGIYADTPSPFTVYGGSISSNSAVNGGGLATDTQSGANPTLSNVTLEKNTASKNGGAVQVATGKYLTIENCSISKNEAILGGGIYAPGKLTFKSGSVSNNTAKKDTDDSGGEGGGIYSSSASSSLTIESGSISSNIANSYGSGIYSGGTFKLSGSNLTLDSNDIYLLSGKVITITETLADKTIATITPEIYSVGTAVISGTTALISSEHEKFDITSKDSANWIINSSGKLEKIITVSSAEEAINAINSLTEETTIYVSGSIENSELSSLKNAFTALASNDSSIKVNLNLSEASGLTEIAGYCFQNVTNLENIILPGTVTTIYNNAFDGCTGLESVNVDNSVSYIGGSAFNGCTALKNIVIPSGVTEINMNTFYGCSTLESVEMLGAVTKIGMSAFENCTSLTTIKYGSTVANWNNITKLTDWNAGVPATSVTCTDGTENL